MHFSLPVLPPPLANLCSFISRECHQSYLEFKRYFSNSSVFTLLITKSPYENCEDGGPEGKPTHKADVTGILYHGKGKETYSSTSSGNRQNWHEHSPLLSAIPFCNALKANYAAQFHMIVPCVHMGLGNGFQIAMGKELGALNALWFPFLNHFGLKNTKGFVLLKRGRANL